MKTWNILTLFITLLASVTFSCGYRIGMSKPSGMQSIALRTFENETFRRGLDLQLTELIGEEIISRSSLRLAEESQADCLLKGKILSVQDLVLLNGPFAEVREGAVRVAIEVDLFDRRLGKNRSHWRFEEQAEFLNDNLETRADAISKALLRLSEKIVLAICYES